MTGRGFASARSPGPPDRLGILCALPPSEANRPRMMPQLVQTDIPFQLKGNSFTLMVLKLYEPHDPELLAQLQHKIRQAPSFFRHAPVVVDFTEVPDARCAGLDLGGFLGALHELLLVPVGLQGGPASLQQQAMGAGLAIMPAAKTQRDFELAAFAALSGRSAISPGPQAPAAAVLAPAPAPVVQRTTMLVTEPVRGGQQIYAAGGDLIVTAFVSPGAELLADGHIHVYGALRGRALAGIGGDTGARIFCQSLEAELISVAGIYRVSEDIPPAARRKQASVRLKDNVLQIDALG